MSEMLPIQRRFLILEQGIGSGLFNVALNGVIAIVLFRGLETVPLWGTLSIAGDTLATTFLLPLLLCLIATPLARHKVARGTIPPLTRNRGEHWLFRRLPKRARLRAVALGVICTLIVGPATLIALAWLRVTSLPFWDFIIFKALFAGGLAALLGPVVGLWAIVRFSDD